MIYLDKPANMFRTEIETLLNSITEEQDWYWAAQALSVVGEEWMKMAGVKPPLYSRIGILFRNEADAVIFKLKTCSQCIG